MNPVNKQTEPRTAILLGATGLVGGECLRLLHTQTVYSEIRIVTRRSVLSYASDDRVRQIVVDFDRLEEFGEQLIGDDAFCAIGTTIKKAGSQERFREIDLEYPAEFARIVRRNGGTHFSLVSSKGANPRSRIFYLRTKGELEEEVRSQNWYSVTVLRPSVIGGRRDESRPGERLAQVVLRFAPGNFRTVPARSIARTMIASAVAVRPGFYVIESGEILKLSSE